MAAQLPWRWLVLAVWVWNLAPTSGQDFMSLVDVPVLVCPGGDNPVVVYVPNTNTGNVALTFFRTSLSPVSVTFSVNSNPTDPYGMSVLVPQTTVALPAMTSRRLGVVPEDEEEGEGCEDFFLLDGRSPVELPDTWRDARASFLDMCQQDWGSARECAHAEAKVFAGYPTDEGSLQADDKLCRRLLNHAARAMGLDANKGKVLARRLKGGYSTGGGSRAAYTSVNRGGTRLGVTDTTMARLYPRGYITTSYGFSSVGGLAPLRTATLATVFLGLNLGYGRSSYRYSRLNTYRYGSTSDGDKSQSGDCSSSAYANGFPATSCPWGLGAGEQLLRDDLFSYPFNPSSSISGQPGFYVYISMVSGADYAPSRICPPDWWNGSDASWTPPPNEDLFVSATAMELVYDDPDDDDDVDPAAWAVPTSVGLCLCSCCIFCILKRRCVGGKHKHHYELQKRLREEMWSWNCPDAPLTNLTLQSAYDQPVNDKTPLGPRVRYDLTVTQTGAISGCMTFLDDPQNSGVVGIVTGVLQNNAPPEAEWTWEPEGNLEGLQAGTFEDPAVYSSVGIPDTVTSLTVSYTGWAEGHQSPPGELLFVLVRKGVELGRERIPLQHIKVNETKTFPAGSPLLQPRASGDLLQLKYASCPGGSVNITQLRVWGHAATFTAQEPSRTAWIPVAWYVEIEALYWMEVWGTLQLDKVTGDISFPADTIGYRRETPGAGEIVKVGGRHILEKWHRPGEDRTSRHSGHSTFSGGMPVAVPIIQATNVAIVIGSPNQDDLHNGHGNGHAGRVVGGTE